MPRSKGSGHRPPYRAIGCSNEAIGSAATRAAAIYRALRHAIIEQALEPGAKLPEDAIGERFGVSRTLVRHALGQLAAEGLVELRRNRGAAVARPSWDEARDIFDVRRGLERLVVLRLAGQLTPRADGAAASTMSKRGGRARHQRAAVDPPRRRVPHPAGGDDRQRPAGALRQRGGLALGPDPGDLRPAAFLRMRGERAPRHHRGAGRRRCADAPPPSWTATSTRSPIAR